MSTTSGMGGATGFTGISSFGTPPITSGPRGAWKAGVATIDITPPAGIWMAGFAARTEPSRGVAAALHAKALALEDAPGDAAVLVSIELLGVTERMANRIADTVRRVHGLPRARLLLNATHTHAGPVTDDLLPVAYDLDAAQQALVHDYTREVEARIIDVIGEALSRRAPARLSFGRNSATFGANRRVTGGPVDHDVPVLRVDRVPGATSAVTSAAAIPATSPAAAPAGSFAASFAASPAASPVSDHGPLALVFGYACHTTTLLPEFVELHGDYAGEAQALLEERHPGATALFVSGCGGDINPEPRGTLALTRQHGAALADAVDRALHTLVPIGGPLAASFEFADLPYESTLPRCAWMAKLADDDVHTRRHAALMLAMLDRDGRLPAVQSDPIQVWRFGADLTLIALGGEVVADYALRLRDDYAQERARLWVAAYSNDVFAYVPSARTLHEAAFEYESDRSMIFYGRPGRFAPQVEERIYDAINVAMRAAMRTVRAAGR